MTSQTYSLYHLDSSTLIVFRPIEDGQLKGMVSVTMTCKSGNYSSMSLSREKARLLWTAWREIGALDCRKFAVLGGNVYRRCEDGTIAINTIQSRYDRDDHKNDFAPKGYKFVRCEWLDRDDEMSHDEEYVAYHYAPVTA